MTEVKQVELEQLGALLKEYKIEELVAKHKPQGMAIRFNVERLDDYALAASFRRIDTAGPYFITLSPLLLEWGFTDRTTFSAIILHELAHIIDRAQNWMSYASPQPLADLDTLEYEADDFVVECGWKESLIEALHLTVACRQACGISESMAVKRLSRLSVAV